MRRPPETMTTVGSDGSRAWVAKDDYDALAAEHADYSRALSLINAYHWQGDIGHKIRRVLDHHGFDGALARAVNEIIYQVEHGGL